MEGRDLPGVPRSAGDEPEGGVSLSGTPETDVQCWRCGCQKARRFHPYALCIPCLDVVAEVEVEWLNDPRREPNLPSWQMTPLGAPCGKDVT